MSLLTSWKFSAWHLQEEEELGGRYLKGENTSKSVIRPTFLPPKCLSSSLHPHAPEGSGLCHQSHWDSLSSVCSALNNIPRALLLFPLLSVALHCPILNYMHPQTLKPRRPPFPSSSPTLPLPPSRVPQPSQRRAAHSLLPCPFLPASVPVPPGRLPLTALSVLKDHTSRASIKVISFKKSPENFYCMAPVGQTLCWVRKIQQ